MKLSDDYWHEAHSTERSERGRVDCAFEAGYAALLSVLSPEEKTVPDHPNRDLIVTASARIGMESSSGVRLLEERFSPIAANSALADALRWAEQVRCAVTGRRI